MDLLKVKTQIFRFLVLLIAVPVVGQQKIDRKALVSRHDVTITAIDTLASLSVGNGTFAYTVDATGMQTFDPTYELAYWNWALTTAIKWKDRLGEAPDPNWKEVVDKLSALPVRNGVYLATESAPDSYTTPEFMTDHPSVLGTFGMLPRTPLLDENTMKNTFDLIWKIWQWQDTWGWDFPMTAMTAARLGMPKKAVDALFMDVRTNTYLKSGHNYQEERLPIYLPGNGGLLTAVAMMCTGWDGSSADVPGFPKDGNWNVKWEGLEKMP